MPNTYTQLYIHIIFAVKNRNSLIRTEWEEKLYKYISGVISNYGHKLIRINGMPDHLHILIGMKPDCNLSDLVREIKKSSNSYIKESKFTKFTFAWQTGYGAFSVSPSQLDKAINYIINQKKHHKKRSFKYEYLLLLEKYKIEYKSEHLFEWIE
jgi:REP element-mobilizing transposase RayT